MILNKNPYGVLKYKEFTVSVSANANIPPWTYYGSATLGSITVYGIACKVNNSASRSIATYNANGTLYVYSMDSNDVVVGVTYTD